MNQKEKPGHPTQMMHKNRMLTGKGMLRRAISRLWTHRAAEVPQDEESQDTTVQAVDLPGRESPQRAKACGQAAQGG